MWMLVMFDLPVAEKSEAKAAAEFRCSLLDLGFEMSQFSVYLRPCASHAQLDSVARNVERAVPNEGRVNILFLTDKQFGRMMVFHGRTKQTAPQAPDQYALF